MNSYNVRSVSPQTRKAFWKIVEDCLTEIYQLDRDIAVEEGKKLRKSLKTPASGNPNDDLAQTIYHDEPIYVAWDIAKLVTNSEDIIDPDAYLDEDNKKYKSILERHLK